MDKSLMLAQMMDMTDELLETVIKQMQMDQRLIDNTIKQNQLSLENLELQREYCRLNIDAALNILENRSK